MSKNNNDKKMPVVTIVVVLVTVLSLGYFRFKSSPDNSANSARINQTASTDDHHGSGSMAANSDQLNALVGKPMPDIELKDKDGKTYTATDFKGKNTVLFFSEGLMCYPACWNQIAGFGTDPRFNTGEIQALSVLVDSSRDWQRAIDKMPELAKANTLFDVGGSVSGKLGLLSLPSSMHRGSLPGHTYIVLDKDGIVRYVDDDPNMAMANDWLIKKIAEFNK